MSVTDARRGFLAKMWREVSDTDASVQTKHLHAPQVTYDTLLTIEANAQAEATRRQALHGVDRVRYELVVPLDSDTVTVDIGNTVQLTHSRYSLSGGKKFIVVGLDTDAKNERLTLVVWG